MYLADYHTHSRISPDARAPMADMVEAAIAAGLDELCFTDHVEPIVWATNTPRGPYDWQALTEEFARAKAAAEGRITLRLGIELGDAPWNFAHTEKLMTGIPELDFIIGSIHMLSKAYDCKDLYYFDPADDAAARRGMADYLELVRQLANWDGTYSVLGHLTLPLRYLNENRGFQLTFDGFEAEIEEILRILIQKGRGIELNTNRGHTPLPDEKWLRMYRDLGGEIITLGTDAHDPTYVGCAIRERQELLRQCGFRRFCTFRRMEPVWHEL